MKIKNLTDLITHEIQDLYSAENQLLEAIPKMVKASSLQKLKEGFKDHLKQTKEQVNRLIEVGKALDIKTEGPVCKGMQGLIKEGEGIIEDTDAGEVRDAGLISAAQRIEHYEISGYESLLEHLRMFGQVAAGKILNITLEEEKATSKKLEGLGKTEIKLKAEK